MSNGFLAALRSDHLPKSGPANIATAAEADSAVPHRNSAHSAPPQTNCVKKTPPTTVTTTVTKALLEKSYQHQAKISPRPAGLGWFMT